MHLGKNQQDNLQMKKKDIQKILYENIYRTKQLIKTDRENLAT